MSAGCGIIIHIEKPKNEEKKEIETNINIVITKSLKEYSYFPAQLFALYSFFKDPTNKNILNKFVENIDTFIVKINSSGKDVEIVFDGKDAQNVINNLIIENKKEIKENFEINEQFWITEIKKLKTERDSLIPFIFEKMDYNYNNQNDTLSLKDKENIGSKPLKEYLEKVIASTKIKNCIKENYDILKSNTTASTSSNFGSRRFSKSFLKSVGFSENSRITRNTFRLVS